jgi:hypothetical protein
VLQVWRVAGGGQALCARLASSPALLPLALPLLLALLLAEGLLSGALSSLRSANLEPRAVSAVLVAAAPARAGDAGG